MATIFSLALLTVTVQLVRRRKLREEHALPWLVASSCILILSVFPEVAHVLGAIVDLSAASTLVLVLGMVFILVILLSHSVIMTTLADHRRDLAQSISLLEWQVRQVEARAAATDERHFGIPRAQSQGASEVSVTGSSNGSVV